jgi:pyruvate/2-oxoglutarate dehydrogenase complex dihydrolipoamide acyltransferase (E2) component
MATEKQAGMDIRTLQTALARIAEERAGDPLHAPKNLALSLAADAGILLSLFRGLTEQQPLQDDLAREAAADALTNILVDVAQLANHIGMDASASLRARIKGRPAPALAALAQSAPAALKQGPSAAPAPSVPAAAPATPAPAPTAEAPAVPPAKAPPASPESVQPPAAEPVAPPADAAPARKRAAPAVIAVKVAPEPPARTPAAAAVEVIVLDDEASQAAAAPDAAPAAAPAARAAPPAGAHDRIDPEQVLEMAKALARQLERSTRDDPVLRELRDELETLSRSLYASSTKKAWIAGSLASIRGHLDEALTHAFAEEVRAAEFVARIDALLAQ